MYPLFETLKITNRQPVNLEYHINRINKSRMAVGGFSDIMELPFQSLVPDTLDPAITYRCRVDYLKEIITIEHSVYYYKPINSLKVIFAGNIDYPYKFADRLELDLLFKFREQCDDILIIKGKSITDTSIANIVFTDGLLYYTPAEPLLEGTCRQRLLDGKVIMALDIKVHDLSNFTGWTTINALRGFNPNMMNPMHQITF
jgi:4-amino-4-deoxychorismate lyase